jgi:hypothetical protein
MANKKFRPADPKFTGRGGGKHTTHDAAWLGVVLDNVAKGTDASVLRAKPIAYHNVPPHDGDVPLEPRPSVIPPEPVDVPGADDQTRHVSSEPFPTTYGMKRP